METEDVSNSAAERNTGKDKKEEADGERLLDYCISCRTFVSTVQDILTQQLLMWLAGINTVFFCSSMVAIVAFESAIAGFDFAEIKELPESVHTNSDRTEVSASAAVSSVPEGQPPQ